MGITDDQAIKSIVDLGTAAMNAVNGFTNLFGSFSGVAKITVLVGAMKLGSNALKAFSLSFEKTKDVAQSFGAGIKSLGTTVKSGITKLKNVFVKNSVGFTKQNIQTTEQMSAALKQYNYANTALCHVEQDRNSIEEQGLMTAEIKQGLDARSGALLAKKTAAETTYVAALGLDNEQKKQYIALTTLGISMDSAAALAKQGVTAADVERAAAIWGVNAAGLTEEQIMAANTASLLTQTLAKWANAAASKVESKGKVGAAVATQLAKKADDALNGSLLATLILLAPLIVAIAALAAIVWAVVAACQAIIDNSIEAKLERAKAATEAAAEAATEAAEAYENLNETLDSLEEQYSALKNLAKGTEDWEDATTAINNSVIELIDNYKELGKYVTFKDGALTLDITSDEVQGVLQDYEDRATTAKIAEQQSKITELEYQQQADIGKSNIITNDDGGRLAGVIVAGVLETISTTMLGAMIGGGVPGAIIGGVAGLATSIPAAIASYQDDREKQISRTAEIATILGGGYVTKTDEGWEVIEGQEEAFEEALKNSGYSQESFFNQLSNYSESELSELQTIATNIKANEEYLKAINNIIANKVVELIDTDNLTANENKVVQALKTNEDINARYNNEALSEVQTMAREEYATFTQLVKDKIYDDTFEEKDGKFYLNGEDLGITQESLEAQLAAVMAAENVADALEGLSKSIIDTANKLEKAGKYTKSSNLLHLFSADDGGALTGEDLDRFSGKDTVTWGDLGIEAQNYFGDKDTFDAWQTEMRELAESMFTTATNRVKNASGLDYSFDKSMSAASAGGYATHLEDIAFAHGTAGVQEVDEQVKALTAGLADEERTTFYSVLNSMDWGDMTDWDDFADLLENMGITLPTGDLENFVDIVSDLSNAVYSVDLDSLIEKLTEVGKTIKNIYSGESTRTIDDSTYEMIISLDDQLAKQFTKNLEGDYVYLGSSMDELAQRIEELTLQSAKEYKARLDEQILVGKYLNTEESESDFLQLRGFYENLSDANLGVAQGLVQRIIKRAGITDLSLLGIDGLTNDTNLSKAFTVENKDFAKEIITALYGFYGEYDSNKTKAETYDIQVASTARQLKDASLNQSSDSSYAAALIAQATAFGVNEKAIDTYSKKLKEYNELTDKGSIRARKLKTEITDLAKQIVNMTNVLERDDSLTVSIENISTLAEEYENAVSSAQKFALAGVMASEFGLQITQDNYEELGQWLIDYAGGDYTAFAKLIEAAANQANISIGSINATTWTEDVLEANEAYRDFLDTLKALGAGYFDSDNKWIWTSPAEFAAAAEDAGNAWENSYDWIYNYTEQINALTREREKLERKFERTLESEKATTGELYDLTLKEIDALQRRATISGDAALKAQNEIEQLFDGNSKLSKYLVYNQATGAITANYPALNAQKSEAFGEEFEEFIGRVEELRDTFQDAVDDLEDIEDDLEEIYNRGRDEYSELIDQVQEALIGSYQDIIDARTETNEAIKEAQDAIVDRIQEQIDDARQARENEKTEEDLADKRLRLAALMRDTSGGNAVEIAQLREEIEDAETDYTDSLVDQALERLQDANEKAAEQRERQIEIAQAQLDAYNESDFSYDDAQKLLQEAFNSIGPDQIFGEAFEKTKAGQLLSEQREAMNQIAKEDWQKTLGENGTLASLYDGYHTDIQNEISKVQEEIDNYQEKVEEIDGFLGNEKIAEHLAGNESYSIKLDDGTISTNLGSLSETAKAILEAIDAPVDTEEIESVTVYTGHAGRQGDNYGLLWDERLGQLTYTPYATGGLADYTGPAWLDGTPSKPELVLNPTDTANFIILKDILSEIMNGASSIGDVSEGSRGDNYFDIAINVESLSDDYDVEQVADKVRDMIYEDSVYRNVNTINSVK